MTYYKKRSLKSYIGITLAIAFVGTAIYSFFNGGLNILGFETKPYVYSAPNTESSNLIIGFNTPEDRQWQHSMTVWSQDGAQIAEKELKYNDASLKIIDVEPILNHTSILVNASQRGDKECGFFQISVGDATINNPELIFQYDCQLMQGFKVSQSGTHVAVLQKAVRGPNLSVVDLADASVETHRIDVDSTEIIGFDEQNHRLYLLDSYVNVYNYKSDNREHRFIGDKIEMFSKTFEASLINEPLLGANWYSIESFISEYDDQDLDLDKDTLILKAALTPQDELAVLVTNEKSEDEASMDVVLMDWNKEIITTSNIDFPAFSDVEYEVAISPNNELLMLSFLHQNYGIESTESIYNLQNQQEILRFDDILPTHIIFLTQ